MQTSTIKIKYIAIAALLQVLAGCSAMSAEKSSADYVDGVMAEFQALSKRGDTSGLSWFEFAGKAREAGDLGIAEQALSRAELAAFSPVRIGIERARIHTAAGNPDAATQQIQALFDGGFTAVNVFTGDPVINSLAGNANYDELVEKMSVQAYPCLNQPGFSDFNFWVGEWEVAIADGTHAGTNSIQMAERGCVIIENWTSSTGGTGMSINYLDKSTDEWVQIWNAEGGSQINIRGGLTEDGMRLVGHIHYVGNGNTAPFRALFTPLPDGRVRQFFEQSNDGGQTWSPWFEGFYTRRPE